MAKKIPDIYAAMRQLNTKLKREEYTRIPEIKTIIHRENFRGKYYYVARIKGRIDAMRRQVRNFKKQDAVNIYKQNKTFYEDRTKESWKNEHDEYVNEFRSSGKDVKRRAYSGKKFGFTLSAMIEFEGKKFKVSATSPYKKQSLKNAREQARINLLKIIRGKFNVDTDKSEQMLMHAEEEQLINKSTIWFVKSKE